MLRAPYRYEITFFDYSFIPNPVQLSISSWSNPSLIHMVSLRSGFDNGFTLTRSKF